MSVTMTNLVGRGLSSFSYAIVPLAFLTLCGCDGGMDDTGPVETSVISLDKNSIDHANVQLNMKAGELNVRGGSNKLIDGKFEFNEPSYRPAVRNRSDGSHASITIEQPHEMDVHSKGRNTWNLQLNDRAVLDLTLNCGAGHAKMDLGTLRLRSLQVHMGAGEVDLDLSGHPQQDYEVEIAGGVGQATVRLPQGVGIRADVHGGLGDIKVSGLEKKGDHYENDSYDTAKVNVRLKVTGGIGEIRLTE